jgi:hypothetical protein
MFHDVGETQQLDSWRTYLLALYNSELNAMGFLKSIEQGYSLLVTPIVAQEPVAALLHALQSLPLPKFLLLSRSTRAFHPTDRRLEV